MANGQKQETKQDQIARIAELATPGPIVVTSSVTSSDVAKIVSNPEAYGFMWEAHPLHTDNGATRLRDADTAPRITNLDKFRAAFTDARLLSWLRASSSIKVQADGVCRKMREKDATVSEQAQRENVVRRVLLGEAAARGGPQVIVKEVPTYAALDGKQYATLIEAQQISIGVMTDMGLSVAEAKQRLGIG